MQAYKYLQVKWWAAVTVVAIPSHKALFVCRHVSSGKFSVLATRYPRALLHYLQPTSDFSKPYGYLDDPCNCHHFSPFMSPRDAWVNQLLP